MVKVALFIDQWLVAPTHLVPLTHLFVTQVKIYKMKIQLQMPTLMSPTPKLRLILWELQMRWRIMEQHYNWQRKGNWFRKFKHIIILRLGMVERKLFVNIVRKHLEVNLEMELRI